MDIRQLRYFLRICSDGSILKASQNVFITQQALSKIISAMEQEIGTPLFFRSSRGLVPTEIGLQLKKLAQPAVDAMDKLNEEISSAVQLQSNNLSLGVSCGLQYFLPQAGLREFSQTHPDISLFIEESDSRKCEALVATGDYTAALTIGAVWSSSIFCSVSALPLCQSPPRSPHVRRCTSAIWTGRYWH